MRRAESARDRVRLWRSAVAGVEVYDGLCRSSYPRQLTPDYRLGVMPRGGQFQTYRGRTDLAPEGSLLVVQPGEVVAGRAADNTGFAYRILALDLRLLREAAAAIGADAPDGPDFPDAVIRDHLLAARFLRLHATLAAGAAGEAVSTRLQQEDSLGSFLTELIVRYAAKRPRLRLETSDVPTVRRAREYIDEHYAAGISLVELARVSGAGSTFRLVRLFGQEVGLPPHAYQLQVRVRRAKAMLAGGAAIADASLAVGFGDQSHFTPLVGVPPGVYRQASAEAGGDSPRTPQDRARRGQGAGGDFQ